MARSRRRARTERTSRAEGASQGRERRPGAEETEPVPAQSPSERSGTVGRATQSFRDTLKEASDWRALRQTPYGFRSILLLLVSFTALAFDGAIYSVALPDVIRDLELGDDLPAFFTIINFAGFLFVLAQIGLAYWMDRVNRAKVVGAAFTASGILSLATARTTGLAFPWLRAFDGVSDTAAGTPVFSLLADYYPVEQRGKAFAAFGVLGRGGRLFAPLAVGYLIVATTTDDLHPNWELPYVVTGSLLVVLGVLCMFLLKEPVRGYMERRAQGVSEEVARQAEERPSFGEAWRTIWGIRTLRRFFIASIFAAAGASIYFRFFSLFLRDEYGLSALEIGAMSAVIGVGGIAGAYLGGGIVDSLTRRRPQRVLVFFGLLSLGAAVALGVIALALPLWVMVAILFVFGLGFGLIGPARSVIFAQIVPANMRTLGINVLVLADIPALLIFQFFVVPFVNVLPPQGVLYQAVPLFVIEAFIVISAAGFLEGDMRSAQKSQLASQEARRSKEEGRAKLLVCRGVDVAYDGVQVLFDVDFDVEEGEIVALLGTNGAGKSTLLKAISGVQQASGGGVVYDGRDITNMPPHEVAARGIVHMPGGKGIFPELTVRENLELGNWLTPPEEEPRRLEEVYEIFPLLPKRLGDRAGALSGGEQQMLSLAQAFLANPRLLLIDELSLGLAPHVVQELIEIVRRINEAGVSVIVVEQSVNVALTVAERAVFMEKGEARFVGPTAELLERPDILRAVYVKGTGALGGGTSRAEAARRQAHLEEARPVLEVDGVSKAYGGVVAVDDVSFDLREGEALGLIGPNGAGKTTLFDLISGYQLPDSGRVSLDGVDISGLGPDERARRGLVRRFQDARLFPSLTVYENLLVAFDQRLEVRNMVLNALQLPQVRRTERGIRRRTEQLIELLGLEAYRDKFVKELSTGLRRITDLACVLATEPKVLLLDEPSTGIAQAEAEQLVPLLRRVRVETGCSMLVIEHDMTLISSISDELIALDQGRFLLRGEPDAVLNDEHVVEAYLGTSEDVIRRSGTKVRR